MIIGDVDYLARIEGFRRGANGEPPESENPHYRIGYCDGQIARDKYIKELNAGLFPFSLAMTNPTVRPQPERKDYK